MQTGSTGAMLDPSGAQGECLLPLISEAERHLLCLSGSREMYYGANFPIFFQIVFSGDLNDVSQGVNRSEGNKSVANRLS